MGPVKHITVDLEDSIRKRLEELRERLRSSALDHDSRQADRLASQLSTLRWVLEEAGVRPDGHLGAVDA